MSNRLDSISWVVLGSCTGTHDAMKALCERNQGLTLMPFGNRWTAQPAEIWIAEIITACQRAGIPYFLKDNLTPLLGGALVQDMPNGWCNRQEMPDGH